jgi:hypothetical protein
MLECQPAPPTTATGRSSKEESAAADGGMPNTATSDLLRSKTETLIASVGAVGGVRRPHGTLAVEGKHDQATSIWLAPSVCPWGPSFSGQCSADQPLTQLH